MSSPGRARAQEIRENKPKKKSREEQAQDFTNSFLEASLGFSQEQLGLQAEIAQAQLEIAGRQQDLMEDQWKVYKDVYYPTEKQWASAARAGIPADYYTARAGQDVSREFDQSKQRYARELQRMGVDPSSPRFAAILADVDIAEAAALAGAKTNTRMAINDANYARLGEVAKTGRGIPSEASAMLGAASQSTAAAGNAYAQGASGVMDAYTALGNIGLQRENMLNDRSIAKMQARAQNQGAMWGALGSLAGGAAQGALSNPALL